MKQNSNSLMIYMAVLAAQAVIIGIIENFIPSPFVFAPGAKLGMANLITIIAIFTLPIKCSFQVLMIRLILTALIGGTFSTFIYSAVGGILSYIVMLLIKQMGPKLVSIIGISVMGGVMHNLGQLIVASWMAQSWGVFNYLPVLSLSGILAGFAVGMIGNFLLQSIKSLRLYHHAYVENTGSAKWFD